MSPLDIQPSVCSITLKPHEVDRLAALCGKFDENLRSIEQRLDVKVYSRDNVFMACGDPRNAQHAIDVIHNLYQQTAHCLELSDEEVHLNLIQFEREQTMQQNSTMMADADEIEPSSVIHTKKGNIKPRGLNQQRYVHAVRSHNVNFGIGPAGTGKTYLAVACAVEALIRNEVEHILLVRPAIEAGEALGFLPGDLAQKVDPYLRPLYDALHQMLGFEAVAKLQERNIIEIAPLAYMRGRTLNNAYIILDESQNTTHEQMKMFLTRIGFGSTVVITGDTSQIDLPKAIGSGLIHACEVLKQIDEISFTRFTSRDVVRHPIVQRVIDAYDAFEARS